MRKLFLIACLFLVGTAAQAQNDSIVKKGRAVKTKLILITKDGQECPVWKLPDGKYYINRKNKKTGKRYKYFLKLDTD
jgi:hypothetical protein